MSTDVTPSTFSTALSSEVRSALIRDLVEIYPEAMPVLARYGFDLCCGGGHTVEEAASLHDVDADQLVREIVTAIHREVD